MCGLTYPSYNTLVSPGLSFNWYPTFEVKQRRAIVPRRLAKDVHEGDVNLFRQVARLQTSTVLLKSETGALLPTK